MTETVTVESAAQLLQTDKSDLHTELKSKEIINLPLNQYRNYQGLINLVPIPVLVSAHSLRMQTRSAHAIWACCPMRCLAINQRLKKA